MDDSKGGNVGAGVLAKFRFEDGGQGRDPQTPNASSSSLLARGRYEARKKPISNSCVKTEIFPQTPERNFAMPQTIARDPYLAAMTETQVAFRVGECNEQIADVSKLVPSMDRSRCHAYWTLQRHAALSELYGRQKRRAM